jgi:hypothetical protein
MTGGIVHQHRNEAELFGCGQDSGSGCGIEQIGLHENGGGGAGGAASGCGWWPFLTKPETIADRIDFIKSQPDYNGKLADMFYGMSASREGEGHVVVDDPRTRQGMSKAEIMPAVA